ncbi:MAG: MarR family transcriptional regulator [Lachnospiraceae bacterium]|nr:MarR family transcriptional regulator [Lachnospiraceae bacterium]
MKLKQGRELKEFNSLYKELDKLYHRIALEIGLSDSAFFILYSIAEFGNGCLQKDIAEHYFISRKTINSSIKNLEAQGYIELKKGNRRDMHLYLTQTGQKFVNENIVPVFELENSVFEEFSKEECQQFIQLTEKYVMLCRKKVKEAFDLSSEDL